MTTTKAPRRKPTKLSGPDLLRLVIDGSGLSDRQFAKTKLYRNERTIRRWLADDSPIPADVIAMLEAEREVLREAKQRAKK